MKLWLLVLFTLLGACTGSLLTQDGRDLLRKGLAPAPVAQPEAPKVRG